MYRILSLFIVLLVSFHVLETDGPCDFEEYFEDSISSSYSQPQPEVSSTETNDHEHHTHHHVVPDHLGHSLVDLKDAFQLNVILSSTSVQFPLLITGQIKHYVSENFRPPRV